MNKILRTSLFVFVAISLHCSSAYAKVVSESEALQVATNFFRTHTVATLSTSDVTLRSVPSDASNFYVFTPSTGKGFVIVSADDATPSILGYSLDKEISLGDDMPCNFRWWCEAMDEQIDRFRATGTESVKKNSHGGISTLANDELLIETAEWNQYAPYNQQCPQEGSSRCATGCTSTSFAIAMRYHEHPEKGQGQTSAYSTSTVKLWVNSRDLSSHVYDWDNMLLRYGASYTTEQGDAVATLMADLGASMQADYTSTGTGTWSGTTTPPIFHEHFDYSTTMYFIQSTAFTDEDWAELMKKEIATNGPIPYMSNARDHQFILDGYNANNYFHINWGWGGNSNGYFLLPDISNRADDVQGAFMDFMPDDGHNTATLQLVNAGLNTTTKVFSRNTPFTMGEIRIANSSAGDFTGLLAYWLTDSEGNLKEVISIQDYCDFVFSPDYEVTEEPLECTITGEINPGDCIRFCYKDDESEEWRAMLPITDSVYKIVITEDMIEDGITNISSDDNYNHEDAIYTLQGIRVDDTTQKGVYIVNGRKVLIR